MAGPTFLIDVDNTLLDNDLAKMRIADRIRASVGPNYANMFWKSYEGVRDEMGIIDFPLTCERLAQEAMDTSVGERVGGVLWGFDYGQCLYPGAIEVVEHLGRLGTTVVVSDGDQVFQKHKIDSAGISNAVDERVLIFKHKQDALDEIVTQFPDKPWVMIDDKPSILTGMKDHLGANCIAVFVKQGKYAVRPWPEGGAPADVVVSAIGDLAAMGPEAFRTREV